MTLPLASIDVRSPTFSTAFAAVGVHTPEAQLMFFVGFDEIVTAACDVAVPATTATSPAA
jgi:hypothetical protein